MKKQTLSFLFLICIVAFSIVSCSDNDENTPSPKEKVNLPQDAESFLANYLSTLTDPETTVSSDKSVYTAYYKMQDLSVDFDKDGKWIVAKTSKELPQSLLDCLPPKIKTATDAFHEKDTIKAIQVKEYGYMLKVQTVQLAYNKDGEYIGYDEESKAEKLSNISKDFIKQYWKDAEVTSVIFNGSENNKKYHLVYLSNNVIVRFDYNKGTWQKIEGRAEPLSKEVLTLMPEDIIKGAEEVGKGSPIVSMEIEQVGLYNFRFANGNGYTLLTEEYKGEPASSTEVYAAVTEFIKLHWSEKDDVTIRSFSWSSTNSGKYSFTLSNGFACVFDQYKEWILIDGEDQIIPTSVLAELPTAVLKCVSDSFMGHSIIKIEKVIEETVKLYYYISLDKDNVVLKINTKGELIGYSDKR